MRITPALFFALYMGVLSQALASEPSPPPSSSQDAKPAAELESASTPGGEHGVAANSAEHNAVPPEPTVAKPAAVDGGNTEKTLEDRELISHGYKLQMRNGEKWFCRREEELGSRLGSKMRCNSAAEIKAQGLASQEAVRQMQTNKPANGN